jgi:hypothetical protein
MQSSASRCQVIVVHLQKIADRDHVVHARMLNTCCGVSAPNQRNAVFWRRLEATEAPMIPRSLPALVSLQNHHGTAGSRPVVAC